VGLAGCARCSLRGSGSLAGLGRGVLACCRFARGGRSGGGPLFGGCGRWGLCEWLSGCVGCGLAPLALFSLSPLLVRPSDSSSAERCRPPLLSASALLSSSSSAACDSCEVIARVAAAGSVRSLRPRIGPRGRKPERNQPAGRTDARAPFETTQALSDPGHALVGRACTGEETRLTHPESSSGSPDSGQMSPQDSTDLHNGHYRKSEVENCVL
jgi:hypothetical protein